MRVKKEVSTINSIFCVSNVDGYKEDPQVRGCDCVPLCVVIPIARIVIVNGIFHGQRPLSAGDANALAEHKQKIAKTHFFILNANGIILNQFVGD